MGLEDAFKTAAERIKEESSVSDSDMLIIYGLFKQSNFGDCNIERPGGIFNQKEKMKWDAWNGNKGMSKDDAMKKYVEKVDSLCGTNIAATI